jgi:hypothetical protein
MGSLTGVTKERHYEHIVDWLTGKTGRQLILAPAPGYTEGVVGSTIDEDPLLVPEPQGAALIIAGALITLGLIRPRVERVACLRRKERMFSH